MSTRHFAITILLGTTACATSSTEHGPQLEQCTSTKACDGGYACVDKMCLQLCDGTIECANGTTCDDGLCPANLSPFGLDPAPGSGNLPIAPTISSIDGTGTLDHLAGHVTHHTNGRVVIAGEELSGATVSLSDPTQAWDLEVCESSASELIAMLPTAIAPGTYTLSVANEAGSCGGNLGLLQGEPGGGSSTSGFPCSGCVDSASIADGSVGMSHLQAELVTAVESFATAPATDVECQDCVGSFDIANGAVTGVDIAAGAVSTPQIATGAVTNVTIAPQAITGDKIAAGTITVDKLAADAIAIVAGAAEVLADITPANGVPTTVTFDVPMQCRDRVCHLSIEHWRDASGGISDGPFSAVLVSVTQLRTSHVAGRELVVREGMNGLDYDLLTKTYNTTSPVSAINGVAGYTIARIHKGSTYMPGLAYAGAHLLTTANVDQWAFRANGQNQRYALRLLP